jgi:vacuolar-type H+-ATPase subunit H
VDICSKLNYDFRFICSFQKGGVPMDVISEIIAYEKHAEEIVADADKKAKAILSDAAILREKERISYEEERSDKINSYHDELKKSGEEHYSATTAECNAVITRLDDEFSKNKERWTDEIYKSIVSVK